MTLSYVFWSQKWQLRDEPLVKHIHWNSIPQYLSWDDGKDERRDSYKFTLKIKENFKFNCYNLINDKTFQELLPKFNIHESNTSDDEEKAEANFEEFNEYKYESPQLLVSSCNNDQECIDLWLKHGLYKMTDTQLYNELIKMYIIYIQECKVDKLWECK